MKARNKTFRRVTPNPPPSRRLPRALLAAGVASLFVLGAWQLWPERDFAPQESTRSIVPLSLEPPPIPSSLSKSGPEVAVVKKSLPEITPVVGEQREFELKAGQALIAALQDHGVDRQQAGRLALALETIYEARKLRAGQKFELTLTQSEAAEPVVESLAFRVGLDQQIVVERTLTGFTAAEKAVPHVRKVEARTLIVSGSLAAAAAESGVPQEPILEIVQQLAHQVDFKQDLREGDRIELTYERFLHPEEGIEHTGGLLSARLYLGDREAIEIYRYTTADGVISFYDGKGVSIETELARTPVVGGFLTSNYGPREHPVLKVLRMHKGMDFAAPKGSAVLAVRAGRIVKARRNGSFGKYIRIDHGKGLETAYAHLSAYRENLSEGDQVKQGEIIGYVGESGLATSPNLHYEVLRNGRQVDPRAVNLPPRLMLKGDELAQFRQFQQELETLFTEQDTNRDSGQG